MSSFRKRNVQKPVPGTRTSPQTGQVITSSGNPSLDVILGGGLPIGSICLIEEDKYVTHSKVLAKYFLAEGILSQQAVFLGSLDDEPGTFLRRLPKPLDDDELQQETAAASAEKDTGSGEPADGNKNGLRIAWRYNDLPIVNSEQCSAKIGHHFNLLEYMDPQLLDFDAETATWSDAVSKDDASQPEEIDEDDDEEAAEQQDDNKSNADIEMENAKNTADAPNDAMELDNIKPLHEADEEEEENAELPTQQKQPPSNIFHNAKYLSLLSEISTLLRGDKFNPAINHHQKSLQRVCITSLASPLWYDEHFAQDLLKFMTVLRAAVRSSVAVCFITMPMHLVAKADATLVPKLRNLVDFSIELESFAGSDRETNPAFRDYNGLFHLHKIAAINTLSAFMPETSDLAFKLRRKKFVIEKLHLPPELQEANGEDNVPTLSCGSAAASSKGASLDF